MQTDDLSIKHQFTIPELAQMGREQAEKLDTLGTLKADLDSVKKQYNAQISEAEAAVSRISTKVHAGWEFRTVRCLVIDHRPVEGYRLCVRLDTGHIAKRRKLTTEESQLKLSTDAPKNIVAVATLQIDDESWDVDATEVPVYDDEFDGLRSLGDVQMRAWQPPSRRLHDAEGNNTNAARAIPSDQDAPEWRTQEEIAAGVPHHIVPDDAPAWVEKKKTGKGKK